MKTILRLAASPPAAAGRRRWRARRGLWRPLKSFTNFGGGRRHRGARAHRRQEATLVRRHRRGRRQSLWLPPPSAAASHWVYVSVDPVCQYLFRRSLFAKFCSLSGRTEGEDNVLPRRSRATRFFSITRGSGRRRAPAPSHKQAVGSRRLPPRACRIWPPAIVSGTAKPSGPAPRR
ncbi:hypothetical protein SEVIR_7G246650v4 [Setaria viridis]